MAMIRIDKKHPDFNDVRFVLSAIGCDKTRPAFLRVKTQNAVMYATDSLRLHCATLQMTIDDGLWDIVGNTAKEIILTPETEYMDYPDVIKVIPESNTPIIFDNRIIFDNGIKTTTVDILIAKILRKIPDNQALNIDYLKAIIVPMGTFTVKHAGETFYTLLFESENKQAVLAAMKIL